MNFSRGGEGFAAAGDSAGSGPSPAGDGAVSAVEFYCFSHDIAALLDLTQNPKAAQREAAEACFVQGLLKQQHFNPTNTFVRKCQVHFIYL